MTDVWLSIVCFVAFVAYVSLLRGKWPWTR